MMKSIFITLLAVFFIFNGINHFYNEEVLEEYAEKKGLFKPHFMVRFSGLMLILGGIALMWEPVKLIGIAGLSLFMIIVTASMHRFWEYKEKTTRMSELIHFLKNIAILAELLYLGEQALSY